MRTMLPAVAALFAIAFMSTTGCDQTSARGAYPDRTPDTQRQADSIQADAKLRNDAVEREYDEKSTALTFREKQIKDKARQESEAADLQRDKTVTPLAAKQHDLRAAADRDKDSVDHEISDKLKSNPVEQEAQLKAEQASRKAEIDRKTADEVGPIAADIDAANAKAKQRRAAIDDKEIKQLSELGLEREEAKRLARERKLDIDRDATAQLEKLGKQSETKTAKARAVDEQSIDSDREITDQVRAHLAGDKALSSAGREVRVDTTAGVVTLTGTVPNESEHRAIIAQAEKVKGVTRVDDHLAVH